MAGIKGNKGHANSTSYPNQKFNNKPPKVVIRKFLEMEQNAMNDSSILCFQDACKSINWRGSKIDYWIKKIPILEKLKKDISDTIIARINGKALKGEFNTTQSIWRSKMLGESETVKIDNTSSDGTMTPKGNINLEGLSKEDLKALQDIKKKVNN